MSAGTVAARPPRSGRFGGFANPTGASLPANFETEAQARYIRVEFRETGQNAAAAIRELSVYPSRYESSYYDVTYKYRLRWNDVVYEPGELKVIAYKAGVRIGEKTMRTAGAPASIRLTPDRTRLAPGGEDLSFILVEALDTQGNLAPLADNLVQFDISGPGAIAAIDNGDQISLESLLDNRHHLFFGKAMLIVRSKEGQAGTIQVTARSEGLKEGSTALTTSQ
jgi:hypothetical protein